MEKLSLGQFLVRLRAIKNSQLTGTYTLYLNDQQSWKIVFRLGRIAWCGGDEHRFRRWQRCLSHCCPQLDPKTIRLREKEVVEDWESVAVTILIIRQQITRDQGIAAVQQIVNEVLFDILQNFETSNRLTGTFETQADVSEPLILIDAEQALTQTQNTWNAWCGAGLANISPNLAPVLKKPGELEKQLSGNAYTSLKALISGNLSLRDLALRMKQDPLAVARSFIPYFQQGIIGLQAIADLPEPNYQITELKVDISAGQPLVVCIDDSPSVCEAMSAVITQAGYRFIAIHDSCQALPTLLAQKPSFIFLDLVMPIASGYEICSQIRRVSMFKDVPVVILTGNDGIVDRVRAKMVGASDFIAKPVEPDKVLAVMARHLGVQSPTAESNGGRSPQTSGLTTNSFIV